MLKEDFVIFSNIRRILIRTSIDYSRMDFGCIRGVVYFRGFFQLPRQLTGEDPEKVREISERTLFTLEKKVRNLPGVSDVLFQFENWRKERGQWVPIEKKRKVEEVKEEKDEEKAESNL
ncbi:MAG: hypothetical protein ACPL6D_01860 [Thermodesulfobacteriota bacterium]